MPMSEKAKFRASLVAALGTATFVAIGVSAQTGGGGGSLGAPGIAPIVSPTASPSVSPSPSPSVSASPSASPGTTAEVTPRQVYTAVLNAANNSGASGSVTVVVDQGRMGAMVQASGLAPSVMHEMHIHQGTACAGVSADANEDGVVDAVEAEAISGPPIIPLSLSGDLALSSPQGAANLIYPVAAADGALTYINGGPAIVLNNLPAPAATASPTVSPSASPAASGAAGSADLNLTGRVVEIHGVSPSTRLPDSAASDASGLTPQQTLGVACGVLVPVTE